MSVAAWGCCGELVRSSQLKYGITPHIPTSARVIMLPGQVGLWGLRWWGVDRQASAPIQQGSVRTSLREKRSYAIQMVAQLWIGVDFGGHSSTALEDS
jgi:hypothetical protein